MKIKNFKIPYKIEGKFTLSSLGAKLYKTGCSSSNWKTAEDAIKKGKVEVDIREAIEHVPILVMKNLNSDEKILDYILGIGPGSHSYLVYAMIVSEIENGNLSAINKISCMVRPDFERKVYVHGDRDEEILQIKNYKVASKLREYQNRLFNDLSNLLILKNISCPITKKVY